MEKIKITAVLANHGSNLWGSCFFIPDEAAVKFIRGKDRRILCRLNDKVQIHCGLMPSSQGYFIMINKEVKRKLGLTLGDQVELDIEKDRSEYGMPVSEEFQAVILDDDEVNRYFHSLTDGKKRNLIHLVNKVKSQDIRINRAMAIAHHLKVEQGKLDFKKLNETIKEFNQKNKIL